MGDRDKKKKKEKHVIIVGGGLVGSLQALYSSKRNLKVDVYESRPDPRLEGYVSPGTSVPLALSAHGIAALKAVGADEYIINRSVPVYGRMVHSPDCRTTPMFYTDNYEEIYSISRQGVNENLYNLVDENPNVTYHFKHKFIGGDFSKGSVTFEGPDGNVKATADLIFGCDGAHSAVRRTLMRTVRMDFSQNYIAHGYKEIQMPPDQCGEFSMEPNYLHIWPRFEFLLLGLPNLDKSFTLSLVMPFGLFDTLNTDMEIMMFFEKYFADTIPIIGMEEITKSMRNSPTRPLTTIKCNPIHFSDKVVLMGDAAHAIVPFNGQGMNCGFEDCLVFDTILEKNQGDYKCTLEEYSMTRRPDTEAVGDLAMYNYLELRAFVNTRWFRMRKSIDEFLNWLAPSFWLSRFNMTVFTTIPYREVKARTEKQDKIIKFVTSATLISVAPVLVGLIWRKNAWIQDKLLNLNVRFRCLGKSF